jgi:hypothetical protein
MPKVSELREAIGALQSEAEFEAAVSGLGAAHKLLGGCDIKRLPRRRDRLERRPAAGSHACALLFAGFWDKRLGILGAVGSAPTFTTTVTIIPFMPNGWAAFRR